MAYHRHARHAIIDERIAGSRGCVNVHRHAYALDLENREIEGESISRAEIRKIASQLQAHVKDLLAISNSLQVVKSAPASVDIHMLPLPRFVCGLRLHSAMDEEV